MIDLLKQLLHFIREPGDLIAWGGYPGLALVIFLETGAMVFFLPGDSLQLTWASVPYQARRPPKSGGRF